MDMYELHIAHQEFGVHTGDLESCVKYLKDNPTPEQATVKREDGAWFKLGADGELTQVG